MGQACQDEALTDSCNSISYETDLIPIIQSSCAGYCHGSGFEFSNYENLKAVVDNGLLQEYIVKTTYMPLGANTLSHEERDLFECWINAGGLNN